MYLSIIILPFLGSLFSGFLGRKLGITGSQWISCLSLFLSALLSTVAFYEVGLAGSPVSINVGNWIDAEIMIVSWEFWFDQVSVVFCIMITYITFLILVYTVYYMDGAPHIQRFFSYLSAFAGFMLVLVTGANYFVMFVGWEGILTCLKWLHINKIYNLLYEMEEVLVENNLYLIANTSFYVITDYSLQSKYTRISSLKRIGPHNIDIISIIIGSTLGDTHLEKRVRGIGTRVIFEQSNNNVEYLMWFHNYLATRGYCNSQKPKLQKRIRKNNVVTFQYRISSYTFYSFNWLHEMFYRKEENGNFIKIVPTNISDYLTPLALAIWFMDDGSSTGNTVRIATNSFTYDEILFLCSVLKKKFNISATVQSGGINKGHILYISTKSTLQFVNLIKPFMIPSMCYKLGKYNTIVKK